MRDKAVPTIVRKLLRGSMKPLYQAANSRIGEAVAADALAQG
jgi:hypothetical protein